MGSMAGGLMQRWMVMAALCAACSIKPSCQIRLGLHALRCRAVRMPAVRRSSRPPLAVASEIEPCTRDAVANPDDDVA